MFYYWVSFIIILNYFLFFYCSYWFISYKHIFTVKTRDCFFFFFFYKSNFLFPFIYILNSATALYFTFQYAVNALYYCSKVPFSICSYFYTLYGFHCCSTSFFLFQSTYDALTSAVFGVCPGDLTHREGLRGWMCI